MNEKAIFNKINKIDNAFRDTLIKRLKNTDNSLFTQNSEDCYLIEKIWFNELLNYFRNSNYSSDNIALPNLPIFINNYDDILEYLKQGKALKLINKHIKQIIDSLFKKQKNLIKASEINYFGGNNKLIIEYKNLKGNALLLINPLDQELIINRVFIIFLYTNNDKINLYNNLLSEVNYSNNILERKYKQSIKTFQNYLIYKDEIYKKDIIKILIYIFYYLKYLNDEKEKIFNESYYFYLINIDWFKAFLEYYDYSKIKQYLLNFSIKNQNINYMNLQQKKNNTIPINNIASILFKKNLINFEKEKKEDVLNAQKIIKKINDMFVSNQCIIIPSDIIYLLNKCIFRNNSFQIFMKKIYIKKTDIIVYDSNKLFIGDLNNELLIIKYILTYDKSETLKSEKEFFDSNEIEDYIKSRSCDININNKAQNLINNNKKIGQFYKIQPKTSNLENNSKKPVVKKIQNNINKKNLGKSVGKQIPEKKGNNTVIGTRKMNNLNLHNNNLNQKNSSKSSSINKINNLASQNIISKINSNEKKNIEENRNKMKKKNENKKIMKELINNNQIMKIYFNNREKINKLKT